MTVRTYATSADYGPAHTDPELVILDEPTNGLDPAGMRDTTRLLREPNPEHRPSTPS